MLKFLFFSFKEKRNKKNLTKKSIPFLKRSKYKGILLFKKIFPLPKKKAIQFFPPVFSFEDHVNDKFVMAKIISLKKSINLIIFFIFLDYMNRNQRKLCNFFINVVYFFYK